MKADDNNLKKKTHEIFSYPFERAKVDAFFLVHYLNTINNIGIKSVLFKYFPYSLLYKYIGKNVDYVFYGMKYMDLARSLPLHKSIVLTSFRDRKLFEKDRNLFFSPIEYIWYGVRKVFNTDPLLEKKSSEKIINFTIELFKRTSPKFLIVSNDSLFIERFLIYCAREAGIQTICIQHGIFQKKSNPILLDGKYADFMYTWSRKQKDLLRSGSSTSELKILGYPFQILASEKFTMDYDTSKICILGQPWENYDRKLGEKKKQIFGKVVSQFLDIAYKPHPAENDLNYFPDNVSVFTGSLSEAILEYDYFFSITSTALIEVSLAKKIAIQLYDEDFPSDVFEKEGLSYTYDLLTNTDLRQYIDEINEPFPIEEDALLVPEDIGERFLDIEKSIENKKA